MRRQWSLVTRIAAALGVAVSTVAGAQSPQTEPDQDRLRVGAGIGHLWVDEFEGLLRDASVSVRLARFGDIDLRTDFTARTGEHGNGNPPDCSLVFFSPCARVKVKASFYTVAVTVGRPLAPPTGAFEPYVAGGLAITRGRVVERVRIVSDVCYLVFACVPPESLGLGGTMETKATVVNGGPVLAVGVNSRISRLRVFAEGRVFAPIQGMRVPLPSRQVAAGLRF